MTHVANVVYDVGMKGDRTTADHTLTVAYEVKPYYGETVDGHSWTISDEDGVASELYADLATGQIMNVWTREDRRGEGLARSIYETATTQINLYHSPEEHCTPEGLAFAQAVGGETIDPDLAYQP